MMDQMSKIVRAKNASVTALQNRSDKRFPAWRQASGLLRGRGSDYRRPTSRPAGANQLPEGLVCVRFHLGRNQENPKSSEEPLGRTVGGYLMPNRLDVRSLACATSRPAIWACCFQSQ